MRKLNDTEKFFLSRSFRQYGLIPERVLSNGSSKFETAITDSAKFIGYTGLVQFEN